MGSGHLFRYNGQVKLAIRETVHTYMLTYLAYHLNLKCYRYASTIDKYFYVLHVHILVMIQHIENKCLL